MHLINTKTITTATTNQPKHFKRMHWHSLKRLEGVHTNSKAAAHGISSFADNSDKILVIISQIKYLHLQP